MMTFLSKRLLTVRLLFYVVHQGHIQVTFSTFTRLLRRASMIADDEIAKTMNDLPEKRSLSLKVGRLPHFYRNASW
jgi:hypothetical protein